MQSWSSGPRAGKGLISHVAKAKNMGLDMGSAAARIMGMRLPDDGLDAASNDYSL